MVKNDYWLKPRKAALILDVHPRTVVKWIHEGKLEGRKIGRVWRVSKRSIEKLVS
jgi:excisionase family DNA binding protein